MQEDKPLRLDFDMTVADMLLKADAVYIYFTEDQLAFAAVNPLLDADWRAAFAADLEALHQAYSPTLVVQDSREATERVRRAMEAGGQLLQALFVYVRVTWPGDKTRLDAFGLPRYAKARNNQGQLILLMKMAHAEAVANAAELAVRGYTTADAAALLAAAEELEAAKAAQLKVLGNRPAHTAAYYRLANAVWARLQTLNALRSLVFPDNYARWSLYALYPKRHYKKKKKEVVVEGKVEVVEAAEGENVKPLDQIGQQA